jgi:Zn-dependent protease
LGITRFAEPYSRFDHCVIAWGGVVAQVIVAAPIVVLTETFGYTRFQPLNTMLAMWWFFSVFVAAFNLIPAAPLDGAIAWGLIPALLRRAKTRAAKREPGWRSWR